MAYNCRNVGVEELILVFPNRFEVLKVQVMQRGEGSGKEIVRDRRCYDSKLKGLSNETTLVLSNTRELNRIFSTKCLPYILLLMIHAHYCAPYPK